MKKIATIFCLLVSHWALADSKMICEDRGNFQGTYMLDISGYQEVLSGAVPPFERTLYFKPFRSFASPVAILTCTPPSPFLDGPLALFACRSGVASDVQGAPQPYEAVIYRDPSGLLMQVTGPGVGSVPKISCQITETR